MSPRVAGSSRALPGGRLLSRLVQRWRGRGSILWETRGEGERLLREELEKLRDEGYEMVHDRLLQPGGKEAIDTILVGPSGVFVFDAKHWWGRVAVEQNRLIQEKRTRRDRTDEITKLLDATKRVGQVASSYVHPYLVLTGEAQLPGSPFVGKVRIRGLHGTVETVRGQIQTVPPQDVRRIIALIDAAFPPRKGREHGADVEGAAQVLPTRARPVETGARGGTLLAPTLLAHLRGNPGSSRTPSFSGIFASRPAASRTATKEAPAESQGDRSGEDAPLPRDEQRNAGPWARVSRGSAGASPWDKPLRTEPVAGTWAESESGRRWSLRRFRLVPLLLALVGLVVVVVLASGAWRFVEGIRPCGAVAEGDVEQATGRSLDGRARLRGGCVFDDQASGEEAVLVLTGNAAERRAPGTSDVTISRGEPCGVLVVAPEGARLPGISENAKRRATAAAACVRSSGTTAADRRRAERAAVRIVAAVRRQAAEA